MNSNDAAVETFYQRYTIPWRQQNPEKVKEYAKGHRERQAGQGVKVNRGSSK